MALFENLAFRGLLVRYVFGAILVLTFFPTQVKAQDPNEAEAQVQPTIMVVPWVKSGEDIRDKIESNSRYRAVIQTLSKEFGDRGFTTFDFVASLRSLGPDEGYDLILENSPADIFIEAEVDFSENTAQEGNYVSIRLNAIDNYSNEKLTSSNNLRSRVVRTDDAALLTQLLLEREEIKTEIDAFFEDMKIKFNGKAIEGRTIQVKFMVDDDSDLSLDDEIGDEYEFLSELLVEKVQKTAFKQNVHLKGNSSMLLHFDVVKIPLRTPDGSKNYSIHDFAREIYKYMRGTLNIEKEQIERQVRGNILTFKIK